MNKTKLSHEAKILHLMFRCEYLASNGKSPLTKKGRGYFNAKIWRRYNDIMCLINKKHRDTVYGILGFYNNKRIIENN